MNFKKLIIQTFYPDDYYKLNNYETICNNLEYYKKKDIECQKDISKLSQELSNEQKIKKNIITLKNDLEEENDALREEKSILHFEKLNYLNKFTEIEQKYKKLQNKYQDLKNISKDLTPIDIFCDKYDYPKVPNKVYKNKRWFLDKEIRVSLNQLITPNAYEVIKVRKDLELNALDIYDKADKIGDFVAEKIKWTLDNKIHGKRDFYTYPEEVLKLGKEDCESHSFLVSSIDTDFGVAYGFYNKDGFKYSDKGTGHAFNVFIKNNNLYILETTGSNAQIHWYNPQEKSEKYHIYFIVTPKFTYDMDKDYRVEFGYLVNSMV
ncbi:MAG: hypothetical protein ACQESN_08820 [Thermotogota bacterium]